MTEWKTDETAAIPADQNEALLTELGASDTVRSILDVVCETTGMGFAAVAHVTESRWVACNVRDDIGFGIAAGGELPIRTTLCDTVRATGTAIVIDDVAADPVYHDHHAPALYSLQSYIAFPVMLADGKMFGTLCAIDPRPHALDTTQTRGMFSLFAQLIGTHVEHIRMQHAVRQHNQALEQQTAKALAEKKVYSDIIESSTASVTALDLDGRILAINRANVDAFERVFGKRPVVGDVFLDLFDSVPEHREQQRAIWSRALEGDTFFIVQEFGDYSRERRSYEVRFTPLLDSAGRRIGASSTSYDVTDRVQAELQLASAQEQLRHVQKMEAMGQLTGGVAHDFNNLLTPIVGSLDILKRRGLGGEREHRLIAAAAEAAERARILVQRLLAFARRQPLQLSAVDVGSLVTNLSGLISSSTSPQIGMQLDIAEKLPAAHADPNQLEMALLNLAVNARDAMPNGGTLRIGAILDHIGEDHPTRLAPGNYLRLSVSDTGVGMDQATLARAIEPFFSTKGVGKGTGLGLSMADGLARQLGGALLLESRPDTGTQASLFLPVSATDAATSEGRTSEAGDNGHAGAVLLVDDEDLVRLSTADMLSELGYTVAEVSSAEDALIRIRSGLCPDLVVTDHLMPGMTGTDLARVLTRECPGVPVLIISGYTGVEGLATGFARLAKPFRRDELSASLSALRA